MKNSKMFAGILMAMLLSASVLAGCGTTDSNSSLPESSESSPSEASVPEEETIVTGVVKEVSDAEMVVTLEDGSELTLNVQGLENLSDVAVGDSLTINYAQEGDVLVAGSIEKVESEEEEEASSDSEQAADQQAESNASQPAANPPAAVSNSESKAAAA